VLTARLIGGALDGTIFEVDAGVETLAFEPAMVLFGPGQDRRPTDAERFRDTSPGTYRYAGVEETQDGPQALFEYIEGTQRPPTQASTGDA
jgi:hypothetical protein